MKKYFFIFFIFAAVFAKADFAPKPEADFQFTYKTKNQLSIVPEGSELIICEDSQCINSKPLGHYGMQKLYCTPQGCIAITYDINTYNKLIVEFNDGVKRESNIFVNPGKLRSTFSVEVLDNALFVAPKSTSYKMSGFLRLDNIFSFFLTLIIEIAVAFLFLKASKKPLKIVYYAAAANLLTIPATWFLLSRFISQSYLIWISVLIFEILFIYFLNRKKLKLEDSVMMVLLMNVSSYSLGMILSFVLSPFLM
ncbi:hypothetical protein Dip510_001015 [Elusimicrobium posterum]|uniref:hypothetical protein n=1 Tax=Elusimicrobium posterum TaxID=3116653 RepID=UPI003C7548AD